MLSSGLWAPGKDGCTDIHADKKISHMEFFFFFLKEGLQCVSVRASPESSSEFSGVLLFRKLRAWYSLLSFTIAPEMSELLEGDNNENVCQSMLVLSR